MATKEYTILTVSGSLHGSPVTTTVYEASHPDRMGEVDFQETFVCYLCDFVYPRNEVELIDGQAYCIPRKCYTQRREFDGKYGRGVHYST